MTILRRNLLAAGAALGCAAATAVAAEARPSGGSTPADLRPDLARVLGKMPARPADLELTVLEETPVPGGVRRKIEYLVEHGDPRLGTPDDRVKAYLLIPDGARARHAMIAAHQDGGASHIGKSEVVGLAGEPPLAYGRDLFERGYVVICPDRFTHAERRRITPNDMTAVDMARDGKLMDHWLGQLLLQGRTGFGKEAWDLSIAADVLSAMPEVDAGRIGAIGHSAGGNMVPYLMFLDPRIRAGVSSCGVFNLMEFFHEDAPRRRMGALALPGLADVGDAGDYMAAVAPRPLMLTRGMWEWGTQGEYRGFSERHVADTRVMEAKARPAYGPGSAFEVLYFEEGGGDHAMPPGVKTAIYDWLDRWLKA